MVGEKLPRSPYWSGKICQEALIGQEKAAKKTAKLPGKAAKKPLLVGEKLPRSSQKLPKSRYWSGKRCQEASIGQEILPRRLPRCPEKLLRSPFCRGKDAKKPRKAAKKTAKKP